MEENCICKDCNGQGSVLLCGTPGDICSEYSSCGVRCPDYDPIEDAETFYCVYCHGTGLIPWIDTLFLNG